MHVYFFQHYCIHMDIGNSKNYLGIDINLDVTNPCITNGRVKNAVGYSQHRQTRYGWPLYNSSSM